MMQFFPTPAFNASRRVGALAGALLVCTLALAGCGGGEEEDAATQNPPPGNPPNNPPANQPPTISGSPNVQVLAGQSYSFTPTASDPNNDTLTFTVTGLPSWAQFSSTNGRVSGTPTAGQVGAYANIQISVSDGNGGTASLAAFAIAVVSVAPGQATLSWQAPTQNTDGSALTDLAGYRVYWGSSQGNYPNSRTLSGTGVQTFVVEPLTSGTWWFVVTAYDSSGNESAYSGAASKTL